MITLLPQLADYYDALDLSTIPSDRKKVLQVLIDHVQGRVNSCQSIQLNFICTHNSRRSQFAQIWARVAAVRNGLDMQTYSGGVEVTAFHPNAVSALRRAGFAIESEVADNPFYRVSYTEQQPPFIMFSKLFDDDSVPSTGFAAVMTCSHADETCPFIPGADARIPLTYEDPKAFDHTERASEMYDARCRQIATEMKYVFSQINTSLHADD